MGCTHQRCRHAGTIAGRGRSDNTDSRRPRARKVHVTSKHRGDSGRATPEFGQSTGILMVDDNEAYRRALGLVIKAAGYVLVGEAVTGEEAIEMIHARSPQIVLMDVHMPGIGGVEAARRIAALKPRVIVILMSVTVDDILVTELTELGLGCLRKELIRPNTLRAIVTAAQGTPGSAADTSLD